MHSKKEFAVAYSTILGTVLILLCILFFDWVCSPTKRPIEVLYDTVCDYYCKHGYNFSDYIPEMNKKIARKTDKYRVDEAFLKKWEKSHVTCSCGR